MVDERGVCLAPESNPPSTAVEEAYNLFLQSRETIDPNIVTKKSYACNYCPTVFIKKSFLNKHLKTHAPCKKFPCDVCGKVFAKKIRLVYHSRIHTGIRPYACEKCEKTFVRKSGLTDHLGVHAQEKHSCGICGKKLSSRRGLLNHLTLHTAGRPYSCNVCNKNFSRKHHLMDHLRIHTKEKPYSCNYCERRFSFKCSLVLHMRFHSGEKPYSCEYCAKQFRSKSAAVRHIRVHTGEKPYSCKHCTKSFSQCSVLQRHVAAHMKKSGAIASGNGEKHTTQTFGLNPDIQMGRRKRLTITVKVVPKREVSQSDFETLAAEKNGFVNTSTDLVAQKIRCDQDLDNDQNNDVSSVCAELPATNRNLEAYSQTFSGEKIYFCCCKQMYSTKEKFQRHLETHVAKGDMAQYSDAETHTAQNSDQVTTSINVVNQKNTCDQDCNSEESHLKVHSAKGDIAPYSTLETHAQGNGVVTTSADVVNQKIYNQDFDSGQNNEASNERTELIIPNCDLEAHLQVYSGEKLYFCCCCRRNYVHKENFERHLKIHALENSLTCIHSKKHLAPMNAVLICSQVTRPPNEAKLVLTENSQKGNSSSSFTRNERFACGDCGLFLKTKNTLKFHSRIHTGEKPFHCNLCEKAYVRKAHLLDHLQSHASEKLYSCGICAKKFSSGSSLSVHIKLHRGERPYRCDICNKTFSRKHHLMYHLRIHTTNEKRYTCDYCNKKLTSQFGLIIHKRIHTGEKPYSCEYCKKKFVAKMNLVRHVRVHTGEKPYSCKYCTKAFSQGSDLKRHHRVHRKKDNTAVAVNPEKTIVQRSNSDLDTQMQTKRPTIVAVNIVQNNSGFTCV